MPSDHCESGGEGDPRNFEDIADSAPYLFLAIFASNALKAATSEEYRDRLERRSELREELSSPEWMPNWIDPYYNISSWKGRVAFFIGELHLRSNIRWYGLPVLGRLIRWSMSVEITTRWEEHDDWPER